MSEAVKPYVDQPKTIEDLTINLEHVAQDFKEAFLEENPFVAGDFLSEITQVLNNINTQTELPDTLLSMRQVEQIQKIVGTMLYTKDNISNSMFIRAMTLQEHVYDIIMFLQFLAEHSLFSCIKGILADTQTLMTTAPVTMGMLLTQYYWPDLSQILRILPGDVNAELSKYRRLQYSQPGLSAPIIPEQPSEPADIRTENITEKPVRE